MTVVYRGPQGREQAWPVGPQRARRSPEAEDSAGGTHAAGEKFEKKRFFALFSMHLSIKLIYLQHAVNLVKLLDSAQFLSFFKLDFI